MRLMLQYLLSAVFLFFSLSFSVALAKNPRVALFDDSGSDRRGVNAVSSQLREAGIPIDYLSGEAIASGALKDYQVVVFTGGSASAQAKSLGEKGREEVRQFVADGNGYVGICAGAYLAASSFDWSVGVLNARLVSPKWRRGEGIVEMEILPEGEEMIGLSSGRHSIRYENGPILTADEKSDLPPFETVAYFRSEISEFDAPVGIMVDSPAIARSTYGAGKVIVSSPHPETTDSLPPNFISSAVAWLVDDRGDLADWRFEDSAGTPLNRLRNSASDLRFGGGTNGVRTNGEGQLEIRRPLGTRVIQDVAIGTIDSGKVWMQLDLAGWDLYDAPTEGLSFGFSSKKGLAGDSAVLEWKRLTSSTVWFTGRAGGDGATDASVDQFLPNRYRQAITYVLEVDLDRYTYEIYRHNSGRSWLSVGRGAIAEGASFEYFGFGVESRFHDTADEYFHIERLRLTRSDPIDRSNWEPIADHPFITAWSWVVADAKSGKIIGGEEIDEPRKSASVTKAMTTFIVCELAKKDPSILDEMVHFSEYALRARGSTANIEAGESLPLREALFAFMLPSGNAVGNAIAEHFKGRLAPPEGGGNPDDPRIDFVAEMNRTAKRLGMTKTIYRSPFGDGGSNDDRTTTVRDLMKLAAAAMQNDLFREVVGTKEYATEVTMADGRIRTASWTNTNLFLGQEGFDGIKTGTTSVARACLLSSVTIDGKAFYGAVLGSSNSSRRYVDSRNMLEWAAAKK